MIALRIDLAQARTAAELAGDGDVARVVADAQRQVDIATERLRDLAQGIFPSILDDAGLGAALATLVDLAPVPVTVRFVGELAGTPGGDTARDTAIPPLVRRTAYAVVSDVVVAASRDGHADGLDVRVQRRDGTLIVDIGGLSGEVRLADHQHLADRVGAVGGTVVVIDGHLRAEIPCA